MSLLRFQAQRQCRSGCGITSQVKKNPMKLLLKALIKGLYPIQWLSFLHGSGAFFFVIKQKIPLFLHGFFSGSALSSPCIHCTALFIYNYYKWPQNVFFLQEKNNRKHVIFCLAFTPQNSDKMNCFLL